MADPIYYHYTTVAGCHAILAGRSLWLSDFRYLNDMRELDAALELLLAQLDVDIADSIKAAVTNHLIEKRYCVLSVSRSPKILSQWRAYAEDGKGFALGFNGTFLGYAGLQLVPCTYEHHAAHIEIVKERHAELITTVHAARRHVRGSSEFFSWVLDKSKDLQPLVQELFGLKNSAFAEEQELRAILPVERGDVKLRRSGDQLIPYVEVSFWPKDDPKDSAWSALPEIWLGPKCHRLNKDALRDAHIGMASVKRYDCGYV